jgi:hypothetical protein
MVRYDYYIKYAWEEFYSRAEEAEYEDYHVGCAGSW